MNRHLRTPPVRSLVVSLRRGRSGTLRRFRPLSQSRRMLPAAAALAALVLGTGVLAPGTALAAVGGSSTGLTNAAGHTCAQVAKFSYENLVYQNVFCIELAIYTSGSGQSSVVAQVEAVCQEIDPVSSSQCGAADGNAAPYSAGSNGSESVATHFDCGYETITCPVSTTGSWRTYFEPLATTNALFNSFLYLDPGFCVDDVSAVLWAGAWIEAFGNTGMGFDVGSLGSNLDTAKYNVCMSSVATGRKITWTRL